MVLFWETWASALLGFILDSLGAREHLAWALVSPSPKERPGARESPAGRREEEGEREGKDRRGTGRGRGMEGGRENTDFRFQGKR